jgi:hypothetical protein
MDSRERIVRRVARELLAATGAALVVLDEVGRF